MNIPSVKRLRAAPLLALSSVFLAYPASNSFAQTQAPSAPATAQNAPVEKWAVKKWSVYWGWNRSTYSSGDIRFWGADHDFTLSNVAATDLQTDLGGGGLFGTYLNPKEITIPQTNLRIAYQYSADTAFALNLDHMKYIVTPDQRVPISGQIKGIAQSGQQLLSTDYLNFEHTDGLNIISLELEKQRSVGWFGSNHPGKVFALAGLGIALPKSNVTLNMLGRARNDQFHLAGYSVAAGAGLEVDVYKDVFVRTAYKFGYVNLPDVLTSAQGDHASHQFTYNELLIAVGIRF
jgi:hypothetical protein